MPFLCARSVRQRLGVTLHRALHHEFWPGWLYYLPLIPWCAWLGLRHGGLMSFTCANPAIPHGGGMVGESKHEILKALVPLGEALLAAEYLEPGTPETRFNALKAAMADGRLPPDYPIVLKPDTGQRGYGVRTARNNADAKDYLARMDRPVIAQAYHPGPIEVGVMWVRTTPTTSTTADVRADTDTKPLGRLFSLTLKDFPTIQGDGRHTLEQLIDRHPRYRCQARVFLARLGDRREDIPPAGEHRSLGSIGNHSQGAIFRDAAEHITPALEAWIDRAAAAFCAQPPASILLPPGDNGLDFCRFDIRVRTLDDLRAARDLAIIELNGSSAESTNIYDPDRSLLWSWRILLDQWATLYRLGSRRRAQGVRPMGLFALRRNWREFDQGRPVMFSYTDSPC